MNTRRIPYLYGLMAAALLLGASEALADPAVMFDFNTLGSGLQNGSIESYMEDLYGAEISVATGAQTSDQGIKVKRKYTHLANSDGATGVAKIKKKDLKLKASDTFLANPAHTKGAQTQLTIDFGDKPITSFEFDFEIFPMKKKYPAGLTVKADGETIFEYTASRKDKKIGLLGHQSLFVFDTPVQTLEFIGTANTPIGIDNLLVNSLVGGGEGGGVVGTTDLPDISGTSGDEGLPGITQRVPEPSSLLLLAAGLALLARRFARVRA